jgi:hypothetical protein
MFVFDSRKKWMLTVLLFARINKPRRSRVVLWSVLGVAAFIALGWLLR